MEKFEKQNNITESNIESLENAQKFIESLRTKYAEKLDNKYALHRRGGKSNDIWFPPEKSIGIGTGPHPEIDKLYLSSEDEERLSEIFNLINEISPFDAKVESNLLVTAENITLSKWLDRFDKAIDLAKK